MIHNLCSRRKQDSQRAKQMYNLSPGTKLSLVTLTAFTTIVMSLTLYRLFAIIGQKKSFRRSIKESSLTGLILFESKHHMQLIHCNRSHSKNPPHSRLHVVCQIEPFSGFLVLTHWCSGVCLMRLFNTIFFIVSVPPQVFNPLNDVVIKARTSTLLPICIEAVEGNPSPDHFQPGREPFRTAVSLQRCIFFVTV
jgi:hypothetical protein